MMTNNELPETEILLSIILPTHNEVERLPDCIRKVARFVASKDFPIEVIIVENGSVDETYAMACQFAAEHPWLNVLQDDLPGKGRAVRKGILAAKGKYRFFADVDFSMPIEEISHFLPPALADYDLAIGSREAKGAMRYNEPAFRHFTGRIFNWIVQILAVPGIQDTQCGFKCFSAKAAEQIFSVQVLDGWAFDAEVLFIAQRNGYQIIEVPVQWYFDNQSKISVFRDSIRMFKELLQIRRNNRTGMYRIQR